MLSVWRSATRSTCASCFACARCTPATPPHTARCPHPRSPSPGQHPQSHSQLCRLRRAHRSRSQTSLTPLLPHARRWRSTTSRRTSRRTSSASLTRSTAPPGTASSAATSVRPPSFACLATGGSRVLQRRLVCDARDKALPLLLPGASRRSPHIAQPSLTRANCRARSLCCSSSPADGATAASRRRAA